MSLRIFELSFEEPFFESLAKAFIILVRRIHRRFNDRHLGRGLRDRRRALADRRTMRRHLRRPTSHN
jgi:hypothetical protein